MGEWHSETPIKIYPRTQWCEEILHPKECHIILLPVHCSNDRFSNFQGKKREKSVTFGVAVTHWEGRSDFWPQESSSQCKSQHVYAAPNVLFRRLNTLIT